MSSNMIRCDFLCKSGNVCNLQFKEQKYLNRHKKNDHKVDVNSGTIECPINNCLIKTSTIEQIVKHLNEIHTANLQIINQKFESIERK